MTTPQDRIDDLLDGDEVALSKTITLIENLLNGYQEIIKSVHPHTGNAHIVGITGSPGAGKSSLVNQMIKVYLKQNRSVGVVAVDPSSPFSGGSILGDRTRLSNDSLDPDVFFRSMSTRGTIGGLSSMTGNVVRVLDAFGKDIIFVETVGAGQNEIEIMNVAHTVILVLTPSSGDDIQLLKAGILEIADCFVLNKADRKGADRTIMDLKEMVEINRTVKSPPRDEEPWEPPILETIAPEGKGVDTLVQRIDEHQRYLRNSGQLHKREIKRYQWEIQSLLREEFQRRVAQKMESVGGIEKLAERVADRKADPYTVVKEVLRPIFS